MALFDSDMEEINCLGKIDSSGNMIIDDYKNSLWVGQGALPDGCAECSHYPECMGLLCPLTMKIKNKFVCPHNLEKEQSYFARNEEKMGRFQTVEVSE